MRILAVNSAACSTPAYVTGAYIVSLVYLSVKSPGSSYLPTRSFAQHRVQESLAPQFRVRVLWGCPPPHP